MTATKPARCRYCKGLRDPSTGRCFRGCEGFDCPECGFAAELLIDSQYRCCRPDCERYGLRLGDEVEEVEAKLPEPTTPTASQQPKTAGKVVELARCSAIARSSGKQCKRLAAAGGKYCPLHDPERPDKRKDKASAIKKDEAGLRHCFAELGLDVRFNLRLSSPEFRLSLPLLNGKVDYPTERWMPLDETLRASIVEAVAAGFEVKTSHGYSPFRMGRDSFDQFTLANSARKRVDPFVSYLESLPAWDNVERLDKLLPDYFHVEPDELTLWCLRYPLIGVIQRAYDPGCQLKEMPVWHGRQNIAKSSVLAHLFPQSAEYAGLFSDSFDWSWTLKEMTENTLGLALVECSEMSGMTKARIATVKAFISRRNDGGIRLAYRRDRSVSIPRRFIMVGTANNDECLPNDPTGNSRFVATHLNPPDGPIEPLLAANRDQLWAEALAKYHRGLRANLPRELFAQRDKQNEQYRIRDAQAEAIISLIPEEETALSIVQILQRTGLAQTEAAASALPKQIAMRLATALHAAGWRKRRRMVDGKRSRLWCRPTRAPENDSLAELIGSTPSPFFKR